VVKTVTSGDSYRSARRSAASACVSAAVKSPIAVAARHQQPRRRSGTTLRLEPATKRRHERPDGTESFVRRPLPQVIDQLVDGDDPPVRREQPAEHFAVSRPSEVERLPLFAERPNRTEHREADHPAILPRVCSSPAHRRAQA
jgi:hypothetical protein